MDLDPHAYPIALGMKLPLLGEQVGITTLKGGLVYGGYCLHSYTLWPKYGSGDSDL